MTDSVYNVTLRGWLSSPRELMRCLSQNIETAGHRDDSPRGRGYAIEMRRRSAERRPLLEELQRSLAHLRDRPDDKAAKLVQVLKSHMDRGQPKVIVFVEHYATALYLKSIVHDKVRSLRVACTVAESGKLESSDKRADIMRRFSPRSHGSAEGTMSFDVLICTDADGVGVNLQDADTVVNYDLTGGADRLVQRLGRILRYTPERGRPLHIYTFRPACVARPDADGSVYGRIQDQYERLFARHDKSSEILGSRILTADGHPTKIELSGEVDVPSLLDASSPARESNVEKSLASHLTVLEGYRRQAEQLPGTLHSARYYDGAEPKLVVLIRCGECYFPLVVQPGSQENVREDMPTALKLLSCPPYEPRIPANAALSVEVPTILEVANEAVRQWCDRHEESPDDVERIAALYLVPRP